MNEFQKETFEKENYERYILVKGKSLKNVGLKITEWTEIFGAGEPVNLLL